MTELQRATERLYGPGGFGCTNIKFFLAPGEHTAEEIARCVNQALDALEVGDYTVR